MLMGRIGTKGGCDVAMMISLNVMAMELVFSCSVCMFARSEEVYCEVKMVFLRYMNYWLTTTTTVTQYSYTVTSKIASLQCTPRLGWEYQSCPDPGRWFFKNFMWVENGAHTIYADQAVLSMSKGRSSSVCRRGRIGTFKSNQDRMKDEGLECGGNLTQHFIVH